MRIEKSLVGSAPNEVPVREGSREAVGWKRNGHGGSAWTATGKADSLHQPQDGAQETGTLLAARTRHGVSRTRRCTTDWRHALADAAGDGTERDGASRYAQGPTAARGLKARTRKSRKAFFSGRLNCKSKRDEALADPAPAADWRPPASRGWATRVASKLVIFQPSLGMR